TSIMIGGAVILVCFGLTFVDKQTTRTSVEGDSNQEDSGETDRGRRLDRQVRIVEERIEFSRKVAQELIAGRLTLWAAAAQLQKLDQSSAPQFQEFYASVFLRIYPGQSEPERYCRRAMALVESELILKPVEKESVLKRLNQELNNKRDVSSKAFSGSE